MKNGWAAVFRPSVRTWIVLVLIVPIQLLAAAVGMQCGWYAIHGGSWAAWICVGTAASLVLPSALVSSGLLAHLPSGSSSVALALDLLWAYGLASLIVTAWDRRKQPDCEAGSPG